MYKLRYKGQLAYDPRRPDLALTACELSLKANEAGELKVGVPPGHPLHGRVELMSCSAEFTLEEDGDELFRGRVRDYALDARNCEVLTCEGQLSYLNDTRLRPYGTYEDEGWSLVAPASKRELFGWYVERHNAIADDAKRFYVGENEAGDGSVRASSTAYPTVGAELKSVLVDGGACFAQARSVDGRRYVDLIGADERRNGQRIEFGVNLVDFADDMTSDDVATRIIATGDAGVDLTALEDGKVGLCTVTGDAISLDNGVALRGVIEDKRSYAAATAQELAQAAADDLATSYKPVRSLTVKAVDLHKLDAAVQPMRLYDWVRVTARPYGVDQWMMVVAMEVDALDPGSSALTLGATKPTMTNSTYVRQREIEVSLGDGIQAVAALTEEAKASALEAAVAAGEAAATAAQKRRVFIQEPFPPYDVGDLWSDSSGSRSVMRTCVAAKSAEGSYAATDWSLSATDDAAADSAASAAGILGERLESVIDLEVRGYPAGAGGSTLQSYPFTLDYSDASFEGSDWPGEEGALRAIWDSMLWYEGAYRGYPCYRYLVVRRDRSGADYLYASNDPVSNGSYAPVAEGDLLLAIARDDGAVLAADGAALPGVTATYREEADGDASSPYEGFVIYTLAEGDEFIKWSVAIYKEGYEGLIPQGSSGKVVEDVSSLTETAPTCPWPVGAVLQMTNGTDPNALYPGTTWSQIRGAFLLGSSPEHALGTTGGEESHLLTSSESGQRQLYISGGAHAHEITMGGDTNYRYYHTGCASGGYGLTGTAGYMNRVVVYENANLDHGARLYGYPNSHSHDVAAADAASAHNNMPPYKVVNMWERTA